METETITVIKKNLNFSNSNDNKLYYEECLAPKQTYSDQINNSIILTHAPNINGFSDTPNNSYLPRNFTILDDDCPPGYVNYTNIAYNTGSFVKYLGRYYVSTNNILIGENPLISNKWQQKIPESNLRKHYKKQLVNMINTADYGSNNPLPIQTILPLSYIHYSVRTGVASVINNGSLTSILLSGNEGELLPNFQLQYVSGLINFNIVNIKSVDYITSSPNVLVNLYETLSVALSGNETYNVIPMFNNSPNYLKNAINFYFDSPYNTYMPYVETFAGSEIPFGTSNYTLDTDIGMITFYNGIPSNVNALNPVKISFYSCINNDKNSIYNKSKNKKLINNIVEVISLTVPQSISIFEYDTQNLIIDMINNNNSNNSIVYPNFKLYPTIDININCDLSTSLTFQIFAIEYDQILATKNVTVLTYKNKTITISVNKSDIFNMINSNNLNKTTQENNANNNNNTKNIILEVRSFGSGFINTISIV